MSLKLVRTSLLSALFAHLGGLGVLFILSLFGIKSEDPRSLLIWLGVLSLVIGALVCGIIARAVDNGAGGSLLTAAFYILPVLAAWLLGGDASLSVPVKLGILAGCVGIILTLSLALPKGSTRGRRRSAIHKSVERRLR